MVTFFFVSLSTCSKVFAAVLAAHFAWFSASQASATALSHCARISLIEYEYSYW